ncbi:MAG: lipoyl domain-containing protein [Cellulomonas sp.]|uniref:lipoyl domain-containing protein n=1 Tax=Cellulomonas sp. 73-92 TaxID=1895740 RepID=UPI0009294F24|nr:lipoyl domain-containing protein [Cellulomonas sp. 73-92]MBN9374490.1 lipoyl domain-containing protein [Cellulomonas sp.]OJV80228.1 MAG: biotin attachment protein [Cellulomonas sp. 73-92]
MTDIVFPALSTQRPDAEGVVTRWFVADGERVTTGQLVGEVQVDKVDAEVDAPADGVLRQVVAVDGVARQGEVIGRVDVA